MEVKNKTMEELRARVRLLLLKNHLSQSWLVYEMERRGYKMTCSEFSDYITGRRKANKAQQTLELAKGILEEYERVWLVDVR